MQDAAHEQQKKAQLDPLAAPELEQADAHKRTDALRGQRLDEQLRSVSPDGAKGDQSEVATAKKAFQGQAKAVPHKAGLEQKLGRSLDGVQAFTDTQAGDAVRAVGANGIAVGNKVAFASAEPSKALVEHEVKHALQQAGGGDGARTTDNLSELESEVHGSGQLSAGPVALMKDETLLLEEARINGAIAYSLSRPYSKDVWAQIQEKVGTDVTGIPDRTTVLAVAQWQKDKGLGLDGKVGPNTLARLGVSVAAPPQKTDEQGDAEMTGTFSEGAIERMKNYFVENATGAKPAPCITTMNRGMAKLYGEKQPSGSTVQDTMGKMAQDGTVSEKQVIEFLDAKGRQTTGVREPTTPSQSPSGWLFEQVAGDPGWHVFGMSMMDGYHSITITVDNRDEGNPQIFWSDQWSSHGGWAAHGPEEFDQKLARLTNSWWTSYKEEKGYPPRSRLTFWKLQTAVAS